MSLLDKMIVSYKNEFGEQMTSPIFDRQTISIPTEGPIAGQQIGITMLTFFLVYKTKERHTLLWVNKDSCTIVSVGTFFPDREGGN